MSQDPIISPKAIALAEKAGTDLLSPESKGTRKISLGLVSPPSSNPSSSSSRKTTESPEVKRSINFSSTPKITIPTYLHSVETYEFLGFTKSMATTLLARQTPNRNPQDVARDWIMDKCDQITDVSDDWDEAMKLAGLKDEVRTQMLKSEHQHVLYTQPLKVWLVEIIDISYEALLDIEANILLQLGDEGPNLRGGAGLEDQEEYTIPQMPGGHLAVYKSVDGRRAKNCIREDGSVSLTRLESVFETDFARRGGLYFTHQLWVAKAYSKLINDACAVADRRTVELHVPLSHFKEVGLWELKFGDMWKQLVYYSRRQESLPKDIQKMKADHGCIQGPISHSHTRTIVKLNSWADIGMHHVLTSKIEDEDEDDGKQHTLIAIQQVWISEGAIAALEAAVFEKAYVRLPEKGFRQVLEPWEDLKHIRD
ncbi:hypothetical protein E8E13_006514 [Curvularia kusanoi]|uniref:Uncharacterized protein n=1 Tax=Curvularia kusanoi TaxID=90978 RepID=A0A9P4W6Q4_CURKU|nr:hypothetical protein E8E13_006514 [Curvularia kusanoi]